MRTGKPKGAIDVNHGLTKHPLYSVWRKIKERLYNPNNKAFKHYGGKGIYMCEEWKKDASVFIKWALDNGWQKGLHVDKDKIPKELGIDAKVYSPETCSILTPEENNRYVSYNVYIEYNGKSKTVMDWANEYKIDYATLHHRLFDYGYTIHDALTTPINHRHIKHTINGETLTIPKWCKKYGINISTFRNRVKRGMGINESLTTPLKIIR